MDKPKIDIQMYKVHTKFDCLTAKELNSTDLAIIVHAIYEITKTDHLKTYINGEKLTLIQLSEQFCICNFPFWDVEETRKNFNLLCEKLPKIIRKYTDNSKIIFMYKDKEIDKNGNWFTIIQSGLEDFIFHVAGEA